MERCIEHTYYPQVTSKEMSVASLSIRGTTMSRSRRRTPITGNTTCRSERQDKKIWHRHWRTHEHTALAGMSPEQWDSHLCSLENEVSDVWSMGKDGRHYWPVDRQVLIAEQIANSKGRSPQERSSLKKRLLHKWMGK